MVPALVGEVVLVAVFLEELVHPRDGFRFVIEGANVQRLHAEAFIYGQELGGRAIEFLLT